MENEKDLINEIKEIMQECTHFAKIGSCYGCSDVKCVHGRHIGLILTHLHKLLCAVQYVHGRYIGLILTGLAAGKGSGAETIDFKSGKIIGTETINGLSRQEMKECIQMASGEYNSFDFEKASLQEIYAIYEKECGNGI